MSNHKDYNLTDKIERGNVGIICDTLEFKPLPSFQENYPFYPCLVAGVKRVRYRFSPVLDLLHAHRVSFSVLRTCQRHLFATRISLCGNELLCNSCFRKLNTSANPLCRQSAFSNPIIQIGMTKKSSPFVLLVYL